MLSRFLFIFFVVCVNTGFFKPKKVDTELLKMVDDVCVVISTNKPFNGISVEKDYKGYVLSEASFKNGTLDGEAKSYYPNKKIQSISSFKNGLEQGTARGFATNGNQIYEAQFDQGKLQGTLIQWREDGSKRREARYKMGQIQWEIHYQNGMPHGLETMWDENQKPIYQAIYENGKQIKEVIPDPNTTAEIIGFESNSNFGIRN